MGLKILPFRQYDEHDVVNLYRVADGMVLDSTTGAGSGDAGTFVKVSAGDFSADPVSYGTDSYLGKTDYPFVGRNQYPKVSLQVEPAGAGDIPLGITLLQTAKKDESVFFFKQKTAYEISECDWSSECALPISSRRRQTRFMNMNGVQSVLFQSQTKKKKK